MISSPSSRLPYPTLFLSDQPPRDVHNAFLHEMFEPIERGGPAVRMDGRDAARVAGVPCLEHVQRLAPTHLADDDAIGTKAKSRANKVSQDRKSTRLNSSH